MRWVKLVRKDCTLNTILENIVGELEKIIIALSNLPNNEPMSIAHGNWSFPGLTKNELGDVASNLLESINARGREDWDGKKARLEDYVRRLQFLTNNTIPNLWSNPALGVAAYLQTLDGLSRALQPALKSDKEIGTELGKMSKDMTRRLRALETRLNDAEPRSQNLTDMVSRIEQAYHAADQLPTDLEQLTEDRKKVQALLELSNDDYTELHNSRSLGAELLSNLNLHNDEAKSILETIHSTYAAATSQGLSAAFIERSKGLAFSMWVWTAAFVLSLILGAVFGTQRVHEISELLKNPAITNWALAINLLLAGLSVGAPIWFGWMATKQINQRFRLSEDYAFKAAVSRAYEGYRKEAARIDKDLETKLLASALARLDEQPLRFVDSGNHGSPWHEILSSDAVKSAMSSIPGFADKVVELARSLNSGKSAAAVPSKVPSNSPD